MTKRNFENDFVDVDEASHKTEKHKFIENGEVFDPYAMSKGHKVPVWLKACLFKWWFAGAIFYFFFLGLGAKTSDISWIMGIIWGAASDLLVNHFFRLFSRENHDYTQFILIGRKRNFYSIFLNAIYGILVSLLAVLPPSLLMQAYNMDAIGAGNIWVYYGTCIYASLMLIVDMAFVGIRNGVTKLLKQRAEKRGEAFEKADREIDPGFDVLTEVEPVIEKEPFEELNEAIKAENHEEQKK